jgi:hypothetical protein
MILKKGFLSISDAVLVNVVANEPALDNDGG